jgi:hypothetical protein
VDLSTPGGAPSYDKQRRDHEMPHAICLFSQDAFYKHCGNAGQAKCGRNPARRLRAILKHAFEIGVAGKSPVVNDP